MNSLVKIVRLTPSMAVGRRGLQTSSACFSASKPQLQNFDPNNYNIPLRPVTMDDFMEPYGSWKQAYEAERSLGNKTLLKGIVCLAVTLTIFYTTGTMEGLFMPNLDNIMEDTEPFEPVDKEGRVTV